MLYFKNSNGDVFAYEKDSDRVKFGTKDLTQIQVEELIASSSSSDTSVLERLWRDSELSRADIELYKVQDSDPKAIGTVAQWREYRKALRSYPESQAFPNKEKRPVSPDVKE